MVTLAKAITLVELLNLCRKMKVGDQREVRLVGKPTHFQFESVMTQVHNLRRQNGPPGVITYTFKNHKLTLHCVA